MTKLLEEIVKNEKPVSGLEKYTLEFTKDRLQDFEHLNQYILQKDFKSISKVAHQWKGYSEPYGFNYLAELAKELELSCSSENTSKTQELLGVVSLYLNMKLGEIDNI